jgi:hypothetical protein
MPLTIDTGRASTAIFLQSPDASRFALIERVWDDYSQRPGLLNARPLDGSNGGRYSYDVERERYLNPNGRLVREAELRASVKRVSDEYSGRMKKSTQQLIAGIILLDSFYREMRDLMAALYETIWILAIGGFVFEDDIQRNLFYLFVLSQFDWLDNFAQQIDSGEQALNGSAMNRAGLYGRFGNGLWQNVNLEKKIKAGLMSEARNILGPTEDHCHEGERPGCLEIAAAGWMPIVRMPQIGSRTCYSNCLCHILYR